MILCLFVFGLSWQLSWCHQSHLEAYHPSPHSKVLPLKEPTYSHLIPISASRSPVEYNVMDEADVHTQSEGHYNRLKSSNHIASTELVKFVHPYSTGSTHYEKNIATTTPRIFITKLNNSFTPSVNGITILPAETIPKPNFLIVPQVETIQKPEFFVHENVLGVIQKPEFLIQDIPQILSKPEYLVQEDIVGSVVKPTFLIEEQINVVEKPEFAIQDDVEIIVKPEFPVQDITEIIPKPTYLVEENVISIEKPSFSIQSTKEIVQKPDIVISPVPVTIQRPEYQIEEDIIPIPKPAFFVQEILETVIKPEFLVTEEVVPVPRPNFLVEEQFQVIQRPNFEIQDVLQTVLKPEYSIQESTIVVQKPEFIIEEVTETVARPTFVEQEVAETIVSPRFIVEEQVVPVPRPQFVVEETVVPIVKPEFFIENVSEVVTKPEYVIEDMPVVVEKPTFILEETPVIVQKPNFVIEETVETINKPEFLIQEQVEVIQKPEFVIQESVVATIVKPKFIVISASKPMGEEFDPKNYEKISEHASIDFNSYQNPVFDIHTDKHHAINNGESTKKTCSSQNPDYNNSKERVEVYDKVPKTTLTVPESQYLTNTSTQKFRLTESTTPNYRTSSQLPPRPLVIAPSLKPQIIAGIEEYSHSTLVDHTTLPFAGVHQTLNQPADFSISTINADYPNIENSKYSRPNDAHPVNVSPKYSLISSSDPEEELFDPKKYEYLVESSSDGLFDRRELPIMIQMHPLKVFPPIPSIPYQVVHIPSLTTPTRTQSKFEPVIPSYSQNIEANFSPFHKADQIKSVPVSQTETVHKIDELYTHDTSNIYNRPLHHTILQKSSRRPTRIETITPDEKNNINGLEVIGKKLGYQVTVEPNDFKAPKIKIKKSTEKSEGDEMFETLYGHHDLVKNGQYHLEADISHPKYGYLFQDQKSKPIVRQDLIENNMDFSNDTAYDYNENYDVDSLDDYYFVD